MAQEEARDAGGDNITPTHLLIGVLNSAPADLQTFLGDLGLTAESVRQASGNRILTDSDEQALSAIGINLASIADSVHARWGLDIRKPIRKAFRMGHIPFSSSSKKSLELAVRETIASTNKQILPEHVVLGLIRSDDPEVLKAIGAAIPPKDLRQKIHERIDG